LIPLVFPKDFPYQIHRGDPSLVRFDHVES